MTGIFFEVSSELNLSNLAVEMQTFISVFNQLLEYTCHSNTGQSTGLSPQVGESKELHIQWNLSITSL